MTKEPKYSTDYMRIGAGGGTKKGSNPPLSKLGLNQGPFGSATEKVTPMIFFVASMQIMIVTLFGSDQPA